jgi:adenosine deaminase
MAMLRERGTVLEICPSSNLHTGVVRSLGEMRAILRAMVDGRVAFTISTDGPEMLRSYLRAELNLLLRHEILSMAEVERAIEVGRQSSFLGGVPALERASGPMWAAPPEPRPVEVRT